MAKILISAGPIPARLDSVKYVTNRFKGGLAMKTARLLSGYQGYNKYDHQIILVKWKHSSVGSGDNTFEVIDVEDILEYRDAVLNTKADMYVLAAAVANLMPTNPWKGKFPSHDYSVGDKIPIEFEIAPRIIDEVKKKYPRSSLVGYKLFDGSDEELIKAGWETLRGSKANIVFANHPAWAKKRKLMLTQDGSVIPVTFDEHVEMIDALSRSCWYRTEIVGNTRVWSDLMLEGTVDLNLLIQEYPRHKQGEYTFGTFGFRLKDGFFTTSRGKTEGGFSYVFFVDHGEREIQTINNKATLNAPLLDRMFKKFPHVNVIIHGHKQIDKWVTFDYQFPGTAEEAAYGAMSTGFNIEHHGYVAGFSTVDECLKWMDENEA